MKRTKILYWTTTGLLSLAFLMSSFMYLSKNPELMNGFSQMGLPAYFVTILGIAKLAGAVAIINPWVDKLREWAYAGFSFTLIGATCVHIATHTSFVAPLVFLVVLGISYYAHLKIKAPKPRLSIV